MADDPTGSTALFDVDEYTVTLSLTDRFVIPPFSVLDTRQGYWRDRKREWSTLGIESELGRGEKLAYNIGEWDEYRDREKRAQDGAAADAAMPAPPPPDDDAPDKPNPGLLGFGASNTLADKWHGTRRAADERSNVTGAPDLPEYANNGMAKMAPGTSIFDPVLCEIAYRWHTPEGARVLDPFAGGSVRGLTAGILGRAYTGIELRPEQVAANELQVPDVLAPFPDAVPPRWIAGDSRDEVPRIEEAGPAYDMVFSCPPYADLEKYSDDPADLSNIPYPQFLEAYREIIDASARALAPDRFAVWVIGEARDKHGRSYGLIADTVNAFRDAGMPLYNEAILVNVVGTLALRVTKQFMASRKMGRCHQHVLVFVKGDPRAATRYAEGDTDAE